VGYHLAAAASDTFVQNRIFAAQALLAQTFAARMNILLK
jgi:hypothetical protein